MKSKLVWTGGRAFAGTTESGHSVVLGTAHGDAPKPGPSPMELVLMGAGGCSAYDIVEILEKSRQIVDDITIELDAERADAIPAVFTAIHMNVRITGRDISEDKVRRAIELSVEKYCSAMRMLEKSAKISHSFEILPRA